MSDQLQGLYTVLRRGQTDWSFFSRERIQAAFLLPPGVEAAPMIVEPIEGLEDVRPSDWKEGATPSKLPRTSGRLDRRLSRR